MFRDFLRLEWKSFFRSSSFQMNLALKIIIGIGAFFYSLLVLFLGVAAYYALAEEGMEPLSVINSYLIYWWAMDLVMRYFMQKTPVMWVRPLLSLPISKKKLTHYLLGKSAFSFFNLYPFFFFMPFSIVLLIEGYAVSGVIAWHLAIMALTFLNNYLNLAVNNKDWIFVSLATLIAGGGLLEYFGWYNFSELMQPVFQAFYNQPYWTLLPIALFFGTYFYNYKYFYHSLYLDDAIQNKREKAAIRDYSWLERFGLMGVFLKNDLRLILRNKRSKNTLWMSFFFLFYGFFFFTNSMYSESVGWMIFSGIFISGGFMFTFGGFVPSWDSSYYQFMMSQNIRYREYLASKWWLMVIATFVSTLLGTMYLALGWKYFLAVLAGGIYNIGINSYLTLLSGAFVKTPIDLSTGMKPFGEKQSFNFKTLLLTLPKILLPIGIYYAFAFAFQEEIGFFAVAFLGLIGLLFRNTFFGIIEKIYKKEKYSTIYAYKQKN